MFNLKSKKSILILLLIFTSISSCFAQYDGYKLNRDGSYAVGAAFDGYKLNSDGSYAVGGTYDGYKLNSDGSYSVGTRWKKCMCKK